MKNPYVVPTLCSDLLADILSRLPVKNLMRLTCVSKSWESLIIGDPSFVKLHLKRSPKNTHILLTLEEDTGEIENGCPCIVPCSAHLLEQPSSMINDVTCYNLRDEYMVVGSCNGLVCLGNFNDVGLIEEFSVQLWNPATHLRSMKSPTLHTNSRSEVNLWQRKVNFGFGYDDSCDTYKVVLLFWDCTELKMKIWVHCIGDSCWREILCDSCFPVLLNIFEGQFVGGCVNWLAVNNVDGPRYQWRNATLQHLLIVSFDISKEVYEYLSIPEGISGVSYDEPLLGVLGSQMCLFHGHNNTHAVLWKMRKYGVRESWTQMVSISYEHLQNPTIFLSHLSPLWLSGDGDILLIANREDGEIIKYNVRDNNVEYIKNPDNEVWLWSYEYVPSLVSPC